MDGHCHYSATIMNPLKKLLPEVEPNGFSHTLKQHPTRIKDLQGLDCTHILRKNVVRVGTRVKESPLESPH